MRIDNVAIKNFRALEDVSVTFDSVTTLIGPNGAGKSTVLRALDWFFNGSRGGDLEAADCSFGKSDEPIEVQVTFSELTDKDREALGKYVPDASQTFTAWKRRDPDGAEYLSANAKGFPEFSPIKAADKAQEKKELFAALRTLRPELGLPAANTGPAIEAAIVAWESAHTDELVDLPEALQTNFFGFNSNGKMSGLFDFVLVSGDLRAKEEAQDGKASIIGKILERSVDRSAADAEIANVVANAKAEQNRIYSTAFASELDKIQASLNSAIATYSPGRTIGVSAAEVDIKPPQTSFVVKVLDGEAETSVERQGHGFQRTLLISSLQVLAESSAVETEGVICLAIEEPELFQHPTQARAFARILRTLAEDSEKRIQVCYATHSPYFIEARHFDQVRRLVRSTGARSTVEIHTTTIQDVKDKLDGVWDSSKLEKQFDMVAAGQLADALFASHALLVEGTTDAAFFYGIGDRTSVARLEISGIAAVPAGGKSGVSLAHAILTSLGIPTYTIFDSDSHNPGPGTIAENQCLLGYLGLPVADYPEQRVGDQVAILGENLERLLAASWPEWMTKREEYISAAGVDFEKNHSMYRFVTANADGNVPQFFIDILAKIGVA